MSGNRRHPSALVLGLLAAACGDPSGPGEDDEPVRAVSVVSGYHFSCALDADGIAYCWGLNDAGQLGRGTSSAAESFGPVTGDQRFEALSAGDRNVCGLAEGAAWCWGDGDLLGSAVPLPSPTALSSQANSFVAITVGGGHACALTSDDVAFCWGDNTVLGGGQLGDGTTTSQTVATAVAGDHRFDGLSAGFVHTCGRSGAEIWCWGANYDDALGISGPSVSLTPRLVELGHAAHSIYTGAGFACVGADATLHCWGTNRSGQLGIGSVDAKRAAATAIATQATLADVRMAAVNRIFTHACALDNAGEAYCWGANDHSQLGRSVTDTCDTGRPCARAPGTVATALRFDAIAPGGTHTCAIADGEIYCWGSGEAGELGAGPASDSLEPVLVLTTTE